MKIIITLYAFICVFTAPLFAGNKENKPSAKQIAEQISKDLKSKVIEKAALADMKVIRKALNMYKLQNGKFPTTKEGLTALVKKSKELEWAFS